MVKIKLDRRNALLISAVLIILIYFGGWLPYKRSKNAPIPINSAGNAEIQVEYQEEGFVPEHISVPIGTTVAWSNPSGRPMWVASDPHPAHTDLPGFDQLRVTRRITLPFFEKAYAHGSGIYEYTFTKVGPWKYHNHLNPRHTGSVIVTEK